MRDSNPRECEPNPLSKLPPPLFTRVLAVCQVRSTAPDSPANREERGQLRRELRRRRRLGDGRPALSGRATLCFSWLVLHLLIVGLDQASRLVRGVGPYTQSPTPCSVRVRGRTRSAVRSGSRNGSRSRDLGRTTTGVCCELLSAWPPASNKYCVRRRPPPFSGAVSRALARADLGSAYTAKADPHTRQ
jgi:hypothetical protein